MLGKKRRGASDKTTPTQNQQKQLYLNFYSLASLKMEIGSILICLQSTAERDQQQNAWDIFADCLSDYVALKYGGPNK